MNEEHEHIVIFDPAYDKRSKDPHKNYGVHGVTLRMFVKGKEGAVQFVLYTNWQLPHVEKELDRRVTNVNYPHLMCHPMAADLGYHAPTPHYEGQALLTDNCEVIGGNCYYDGSGLNAQRIYAVLRSEGDIGVWRELEEYYKATFLTKEETQNGETYSRKRT